MANVPSSEVTSQSYLQHLTRLQQRREEVRQHCAAAIGAAPTICLEIGCGHGHFLTAYARAHPNEACLGVDIASDRIARASRKCERAGLDNLHFVRADVHLLLDALPSTVLLSNIFMLFPDPWPKLRHQKHRVAQPAFLSRLAERMGQGGRFYFRTDHLPYFEFVRGELHRHPDLAPIDEPWRFEFTTVFQARAPVYHSLVAGLRAPRA
jgi:tRNA (guanine-N7-)-methyltransferase